MGIKTVTTVTVTCDSAYHDRDKVIEQGQDYVNAPDYTDRIVCLYCWDLMTAPDLVKFLGLDGIYRETVGRERTGRKINA